MIIRDVVLLTKSNKRNTDILDHRVVYNEQIVRGARVTELNGSQSQNNAIGRQYNHSYVIRLEGIYNADKIAFIEDYQENNSHVLQIAQIRKHHFKTDIYCGDTEVKS
ncbi:hypothetical protein FHL06_04440 [Lactobacillus halodurans]|uniref:Head-tail adaptor protein n=1 Tax=Companilactobacillus halodurans TaxID=2584183 RepID=A0A5P0ZTL3_9LACO|nr:hypothetical protein [Companilactobacillus halodurans]MQS75636.1 hypothetical protein [Companilactobacillus halodurans]MQS96349.1 hypothetical protein [Companilactobacillus halodurans]